MSFGQLTAVTQSGKEPRCRCSCHAGANNYHALPCCYRVGERYAVKPSMPPARVEYDGLFGRLMFASDAEFIAWRAEPLWRRVLGRTAYDRRLAGK